MIIGDQIDQVLFDCYCISKVVIGSVAVFNRKMEHDCENARIRRNISRVYEPQERPKGNNC